MSIKIENIVPPSISQWQNAIEGMRIPMWSGDKSDSSWDVIEDPSPINPEDMIYIKIGPNDMSLMRRLAKAGSDHRKFLRMLPVSMKITAPMVWLAQFDTYKVATVSCGSSKMHKLMYKPFEFSDFGYDDGSVNEIPEFLCHAVARLNSLRNLFLHSEDEAEKAKAWKEAIDILPESYHQTRVWGANYEVLWSMYQARKNHRLPEWREFCDTITREVPYFAEIFGIEAS